MKPRQQVMVTEADGGTVSEGVHRAMEALVRIPEFKPLEIPIENSSMPD